MLRSREVIRQHRLQTRRRGASTFRFTGETSKGIRTMDALRTAVSKLINAYISGTLFTVFRNPTFLGQDKILLLTG
jgi:hypothetical protein